MSVKETCLRTKQQYSEPEDSNYTQKEPDGHRHGPWSRVSELSSKLHQLLVYSP